MGGQPISDEALGLPKIDPTHDMKSVGDESIYSCMRCHACECHYGDELAVPCTGEPVQSKSFIWT